MNERPPCTKNKYANAEAAERARWALHNKGGSTFSKSLHVEYCAACRAHHLVRAR